MSLSGLLFFWTFILPEAGKYVQKLDDPSKVYKSPKAGERSSQLITEQNILPDLRNSAITGQIYNEKLFNFMRPSRARIYS